MSDQHFLAIKDVDHKFKCIETKTIF